jgi:hypothetical protein
MSNTTRDVRRSRTILSAIAVGLLAAALVSGSALAGKPSGSGGGGKGGGKPGGGATPTAQVFVAPNPVPAYSEFRITGCGYTPNAGVQFNLYAPGVTAVWGGMVDGNGCLFNAVGWANSPGSATLDVLLNSVTRVGTTTFTIR